MRLTGLLKKLAIPTMNWIPSEDGKPEKWTLVIVRCENHSGTNFELEGFWTGSAWRIVGYKQRRQDLRVTTWAYKI